MASTQETRPKRKRHTVSYYEEATDISEYELYDDVADNHVRKTTTRNKKAKRASAVKTGKAFLFMALPAEIRNIIYALVLLPPKGQSTRLNTRFVKSRRVTYTQRYKNDYQYERRYLPKVKNRTAFLQANRQICVEATTILYAQKLTFTHNLALLLFLPQIGPVNRVYLREIVLQSWGYGVRGRDFNTLACNMLQDSVKNLRSLTIAAPTFELSYGRIVTSPKVIAKIIHQDALDLLEAIGRSHGSRDAAIGVLKVHGDTVLRIMEEENGWQWAADSSKQVIDVATSGWKSEFESEMRGLLLKKH